MDKLARQNIEDIVALTSLQEGMFFHYLREPGSRNYFEQLSLDISGKIHRGVFEKAWNFVIKTNELLRTVYRWERLEQPIQIILKEHQLQPGYYDLTAKDDLEREKRLEELKIQDRKRKFDLRQVPFRVNLCKTGDDRYQLIISNHHILYDGWSNGIILKEFFDAYNALYQGKKPAKPGKAKFKEFVRWMHIKNRDIAGQEKFWKDFLKGFDTPTGLPVKNKKKARGTHIKKPANDGIRFSKAFFHRLESFVKTRKITLASLLYTSWGVLLQKYNNRDDVVFGTTISGRSAKIKGIENTVGLFINTLPLGVRNRAGEKIGEEVVRINQLLQVREEYAYTPLANIKTFCEPGNNEALFDSIVTVENYPLSGVGGKPEEPEGILSVNSYSQVEVPHYDLAVIISIFKDFEVNFIYDSVLFEKETIARLSGHFEYIIKGIIEDPGKLVTEIEMMPVAEKDKILYEFNRTHTNYPKNKTIQHLFAEQVERTPDRLALIGKNPESEIRNPKQEVSFGPINACGENSLRAKSREPAALTYKELNEKSGQLALLLQEKGVQPDAIVGIVMERSIDMVIAVLGILKAGGAYLPIEPGYPGERISYMIADSGAKILVTSPVLPGRFEKFLIDKCRLLAVKKKNNIKNHQLPIDHLQLRGNNLAYVIYTSGSTGKPKGVLVEHTSVVNTLFALQEKYPFGESDVYLLKTSYAFDVSVTELLGWFSGDGKTGEGGGRLVILERGGEKDPKVIMDTIARLGVTHVNFVPSMFNVFVEALNYRDIKKLPGLKYIFLAGEVLLPGLVDRFRTLDAKIVLVNIYGPTEAAIYSSWFSLSRWRGSDIIPIGKPLPNVKLYILDRYEGLQAIAIPGELCIAGAGVARGYLNNPELTFERFISFNRSYMSYKSYITHLSYYKTGDLARWLADGNIQFLARIDQQVKIRGYRIEPGEIESRLLSHHHIKEAVVAVHEDGDGDKYLCAYVSRRRAVSLSLSALREYLALTLPGYMVPSHIVQLDRLPLTPGGKVDREALPMPSTAKGTGYMAPRDEIEEKLVDIWSRVLVVEKEKIGINCNFFELGGHSLKANLLALKIHKDFHVKVPLNEIFKRPRVSQQAAFLRAAAKGKYTRMQVTEKKDYYLLSSVQKRLYFLQRLYQGNRSYNLPGMVVVRGFVEFQQWQRLFEQLIERHDSLRTSFHMIADEPVQRVHEVVEFELEFYDVRAAGAGDGMEPAASTIRDFVRSFDLAGAPLLRVGLIRTTIEEHVLMVDMHHIITDGTSIGIFKKEFAALYAGQDLPPLKVQYTDYAEWQNRKEYTEIVTRQEKYWLETFAGKIPGLNLPTDFPRPVVSTFAGSALGFEVGEEETRLIKELTLKEEVTLFIVLLALYNIFLSQLSGQEEIVVGTSAAGRRRQSLQHIMGMFVNAVALRNFPEGRKTFNSFLQEVKERTLTAFDHQDYQYENLVEKIDVTREKGKNPVFSVMLVLNNEEFPELDLPGLTLEPHTYTRETAQMDLKLRVREEKDKLLFSMEYSTDLFKKETIAAFVQNFKEIVSMVINQQDIPLKDINISYDFADTAANMPETEFVF